MKPKKDYEKTYRAQRKKYYRNYLSQIKELYQDSLTYSTFLAELKFQNIEDVDIITEVEKELE